MNVHFFTAVTFGDQPKSCSQSLLETVDNYFYLGGKKACVIPGHTQSGSEGTILVSKETPSFAITALKVITYLTVALPVIMLILKAVLRSIHTFHIIHTEQKLEEGIDISQATIAKIHALMPEILERQIDRRIKWHNKKGNLIFSLIDAPHLIFKIPFPGAGKLQAARFINSQQGSDKRFANMVKALEVCLVHQLDLLIIPRAKKFDVDGMTLIAEERLDIQQNESVQEELYQILPDLNETTKQLATFIAKTGFSDVEWRNIPTINGSRRVALIDLQKMDGAETGIFGGGLLKHRGLIQCLSSEEQIDIALDEANHHGIVHPSVTPAQAKARRMEQVKTDQQLHQFHQRKKILENARKPIPVANLNTLRLDLNEQRYLTAPELVDNSFEESTEGQFITLKQAAIDVIHQINTAISEAPEADSPKAKRNIILNTNQGRLNFYLRTGLAGQEMPDYPSDEQRRQTWLARIINALVATGDLFQYGVNGQGYRIQA